MKIMKNIFWMSAGVCSAAALTILPGPAWAHQGFGGQGFGGHMMGWGFGGGFTGGLFMAIFWIAVIVGAAFLIRWVVSSDRNRNPGQPGQDSLEILKIRYAKGELSQEQFETLKKDLMT